MNAEDLLKGWGLKIIASDLCGKLDLKTMDDIKSLSNERIDGLDIKPAQKRILKELRDVCVSGRYEEERRRRQEVADELMREPAFVGDVDETSIEPVDIRTLLCRMKQFL